MKKAALIIFYFLGGCQNKTHEDVEQRKIRITQQTEQRVSAIINQLKEDCDSSIMQTGRFKVDSIKARLKKAEKVNSKHR